MTIQVAIVEDDEEIRANLTHRIGENTALCLVGSYADAESALSNLPLHRPNVVLMDINLPGMDGVECVRRLKPQMPETQFVMLTVYEDTNHIFAALAAGATGYLLKSTRREELVIAIDQIVNGGSPMSSGIARKVVQSFGRKNAGPEPMAELSPREQSVLALLAKGYLYKEIADSLGVGVPTVDTYIRRIYEKLQVHSRSEAIAKYFTR